MSIRRQKFIIAVIGLVLASITAWYHISLMPLIIALAILTFVLMLAQLACHIWLKHLRRKWVVEEQA